MKKLSFILAILFVFMLLIFNPVNAANAVPQKVLDARESLVRVFTNDGDDYYTGSGFVVGEDAFGYYIVTNWHVVEKNRSNIGIMYNDEVYTNVNIKRKSNGADLCILYLTTDEVDIKPLIIANHSTIKVGDPIYAIGFPGASDYLSDEFNANFESVTITDGIISTIKTGALVKSNVPIENIQINASISRGNSGGPLLNKDGEVIGVNSFVMLDAQNINVAVSIKELIPLLNESDINYNQNSLKKATLFGKNALSIIIVVGAVFVITAIIIFLVRFLKGSKRKKAKVKIKKEKKQNYYEYFGNINRTLDEKLYAILHVIEQVKELHKQSRYNLGICPENITVIHNQASLMVHKKQQERNIITDKQGYYAPELYNTNGIEGPWTDVYAYSAIVYEIISGKPLSKSFERKDNDDLNIKEDMDEIYSNIMSIIRKGLELNYQQRTITTDELIMHLHIILYEFQTSEIVITNNGNMQKPIRRTGNQIIPYHDNLTDSLSRSTMMTRETKLPRKKLSKQVKSTIVWGLCLVALITSGTIFIYNTNSSYENAIIRADKADFKIADTHISKLWIPYKNSVKLHAYIDAGLLLDNGKYDKATEAFSVLGNYFKAEEMIDEVQYRYAVNLLNNKQFDEAKTEFSSLGEYKDSSSMINEVDYANAVYFLENAEYENAIILFTDLNDYKDSKDMVMECEYQKAVVYISKGRFENAKDKLINLITRGYSKAEELYNEVVYLMALDDIKKSSSTLSNIIPAFNKLQEINPYKDSNKILEDLSERIMDFAYDKLYDGFYKSAKAYFNIVEDYFWIDDLIEICDMLNMIEETSDKSSLYYLADRQISITRSEYKTLLNSDDIIDIDKYLLEDAVIQHFLNGRWKTSSGRYYFEMYWDKESWYADYNLPWKDGIYYNIKDAIYSLTQKKGSDKKVYRFIYINYNTIKIYCYKDKKTYTLYRE